MESDKKDSEQYGIEKQNKYENTPSAKEPKMSTLRSYDQLRTHFPIDNVTSDRHLNVLRVPEQNNKTFNYLKNLESERGLNANTVSGAPNFGDKTPSNFLNISGQYSANPLVQLTPGTSALSTVLQNMDTALYFRSEPTFARPFWPFQRWHSSHFLNKNSASDFFEFSRLSEFRNSHLSILSSVFKIKISHIRGTVFHSFIHSLWSESVVKNSEEITQIRKSVEEILIDTFDDLSRRYKLFRNYSVLKMGSMYEETKVGIPDEFDFMIEIPELQDQSLLEFVDDDYWKHVNITKKSFSFQDSEIRDVRIKDRTYFGDILEMSDDEDDKSFVRSLWNKIHNQVAESIKSVLPQGWKWLDLTPGVDTLALTQCLLWEGKEFPKLVINLDICLSVPLNINESCKEEEKQPEKHAIIRSNGISRYTYAVREIGIWKKFEREDGRKVVYRITKVILSSFLPKTYNDDLFRLDSCVPSYWIKTIMFYLFECYKDDIYWTKEEISLRVLEVLLLLEKCLDCKELSSYFVPHNILKSFAWKNKLEEFHILLQNVTDLNILLLESCLKESESFVKLSELQSMMKTKNKKCLDDGLLQFLIETCYLYAYNDYQEDTMKNIRLFVSLFLDDTVELCGEGKELQIYHKGVKININELIYKKYDDDAKYFKE